MFFQVFMLALTFLVLFLGNFLTTVKVVHQKVQKKQEKVQKNDWDENSDSYKWPVILKQHAQSLDRLTHATGREKTKLKPLFLSGFDGSSVQPKYLANRLLLSNDLSSMLLHSRSQHSVVHLIDGTVCRYILYIKSEREECVFIWVFVSAHESVGEPFVQIICN